MDSIDYENDFVFLTDKQGQLTGGGFTIRSELLENTIYGDTTNTIDGSNYQIGAGLKSSVNHNTTLKSFKDMVVPAGLFYIEPQSRGNKNHKVKYENSKEPIEDTLYDKLLELVSPDKRASVSIKTRKKRDKKQKMTRKNK